MLFAKIVVMIAVLGVGRVSRGEGLRPAGEGLRVPERIDWTRSGVDPQGQLRLVTSWTLRDSCEALGPMTYRLEGGSILIESTVTRAKGRLCAEVLRENVRREDLLQNLERQQAYHVYYIDEEGTPVDFGPLPSF